MKYEKIKRKIQKLQDDKRFEHTLGVTYTSICLAMKYGADIEKAKLAGLLHDCAKQLPSDKLIKICQKNNISISEVEYKNPFLLHGKAGTVLAKKKFKIKDEDIINAIFNHTTGRPNMSLLEKIVFVADYIEPGRSSAPNLMELRKLAFEDLDLCLLKVLEGTLNYLNKNKDSIDPSTQKTFDYYLKEHTNNVNK